MSPQLFSQGGNGTRLEPITNTRCKPAVCFGGKYRLIDIPISNAIHSGCSKIFVISQYLSSSLNQHIFNTYHPGAFSSTAIELISQNKDTRKNHGFRERRALFDKIYITSLKLLQSIF